MRTREQESFAAALHKMLSEVGDAWPKLAGMGVTTVAADGSLADVAVACEELGHHALPGPVAETVAAVPVLLAALPDGMAALDGGRPVVTLAMPPCLPFAADAEQASLVLLARDGVVYLGEAGARHLSVDPGQTLHEIRPVEVLARHAGEAIERSLRAGTLACAAYLLGAGRALLEMSVRHAGIREQFWRPVGSNQAVQHLLANVAIGLEFAGPLLGAASGSGSALDVSAAKVACAEAASGAARAALQVHGAIGYTAEHELSRYLLRVRALAGAWGTLSWHRARIGEAIGGP
jgi:hypothetical protein